ncbi:T9SS type A sorting domain-containing protein [bacterium]|nr:T9SS type A sorting domain-containing protein [bacterium]
MKKIFSVIVLLFCSLFTFSQVNSLQLQGIIDFDLVSAGYTGKALHLKANSNISDLSNYGIGVANNGNGGDGQEYSFPSISVQAGDHILLARDTISMATYFNSCFSQFDHVLAATNAISQNGNDAIELFKDSIVIETFGDINVDGTGLAWEYLDSWAFKDPSGGVTFSGGNWIFGGVECTIGSLTTQSSSCPYPSCSSGSSIEDFNNFSFSVYPNPSNQQINIESEQNFDNIKIFDATARELKNFTFNNKTINIENLPKGFYIIRFLRQENVVSKTFIKN